MSACDALSWDKQCCGQDFSTPFAPVKLKIKFHLKSWILSGGCERVDGDSCSLLDGTKPGPASPEGLGAKPHFLFGPGSPL